MHPVKIAEIQAEAKEVGEDLNGTVAGWFDEVVGQLGELQEVLRSAALRKIIKSLESLQREVVGDSNKSILGRVSDIETSLEGYDPEDETES